MCKGEGCPFAAKCYRCTAVPDEVMQAYFNPAPYDPAVNVCAYYWDNSKYN